MGPNSRSLVLYFSYLIRITAGEPGISQRGHMYQSSKVNIWMTPYTSGLQTENNGHIPYTTEVTNL